jgi:hypothetical protein
MTLSVYIASYGRMNDGLERSGCSHGLIEVIPWHVLGGTEETHKKILENLMPKPQFRERISQIQA